MEGEQVSNTASATSTPTNQPFYREITDHNVPYPRCSGARFCGDGNLVCFGLTRQYVMKYEDKVKLVFIFFNLNDNIFYTLKLIFSKKEGTTSNLIWVLQLIDLESLGASKFLST